MEAGAVAVAGGLVVLTACGVLDGSVGAEAVVVGASVVGPLVVTGGAVTVAAAVVEGVNTGAGLVSGTTVVLTTEVDVVVAAAGSQPASAGQSHTAAFGFQCRPDGQFFSAGPL